LSVGRENLENLNTALLKLEKNPSNQKPLKEMLRYMHNLKSTADTMKYDKMTELCHTMEDVLDEIKNRKRELTPEIIDLLFKCFDYLDISIKQISKGKEEADSSILVSKLKLVLSTKPEEKIIDSEGIGLAEKPEAIEEISEIRVKVETLDALMNLTEELLVNKMMLDQLYSSEQFEEMGNTLNALGMLATDLQYNITQARLVPVGQIFTGFPRMVRDLAKKENKQINLIIGGGDIELDKTIIDKLGEPLVHLLRNAVDHGIEKSEIRTRRKKPATGTIRLTAKREKSHVIIEVEDDGEGMSDKRIKEKAIEKGIISRGAAAELNHEGIISLLCDSGFSTTKKVTEVSGRGVGLDVVKTTIDTLGGIMDVNYRHMKGMKVTLKLPLTLAIIKALLTGVEDEVYAIPIGDVIRSVRLKPENIRQVANQEMATLDEGSIVLIKLAELFNIPKGKSQSPSEEGGVLMVIVNKGKERLGLGVNSVIADQDIIVKPLDKLTRQSRWFSGFTILGDGRAALILDIDSLIQERYVKK